jgi:hypothetical protein
VWKKGEGMTPEELSHICQLTFELVRLRQNECKHLCIENTAADIFGRLLNAYACMDRPLVAVDSDLESPLEQALRFRNKG